MSDEFRLQGDRQVWIAEAMKLSHTCLAGLPAYVEREPDKIDLYDNPLFWDGVIYTNPLIKDQLLRVSRNAYDRKQTQNVYFDIYASQTQKREFADNQKNIILTLDKMLHAVNSDFIPSLKNIEVELGLVRSISPGNFPAATMQYVGENSERFKDNPHLKPLIVYPQAAKKLLAENENICTVRDLGNFVSSYVRTHHDIDMNFHKAFLIARHSMVEESWQELQDKMHANAVAKKKPTFMAKPMNPDKITKVSDANVEFMRETEKSERGRRGRPIDLWKPENK